MRIDHIVRATSVGFPSGQRDQTVNLTRKLRWFESSPHHQFLIAVGMAIGASR